jgi:hypothetical protein
VSHRLNDLPVLEFQLTWDAFLRAWLK